MKVCSSKCEFYEVDLSQLFSIPEFSLYKESILKCNKQLNKLLNIQTNQQQKLIMKQFIIKNNYCQPNSIISVNSEKLLNNKVYESIKKIQWCSFFNKFSISSKKKINRNSSTYTKSIIQLTNLKTFKTYSKNKYIFSKQGFNLNDVNSLRRTMIHDDSQMKKTQENINSFRASKQNKFSKLPVKLLLDHMKQWKKRGKKRSIK